MYIKFIFFACVALCLWNTGVLARCVMRGTCAVVNGLEKPCPVDTEPPALLTQLPKEERDHIFSLLELRCPFVLYDESGNLKPDEDILLCCDAEQIRSMTNSMLLAAGVLGRCPTCLGNFVRQICEMNCAPDQARFVNVTTMVTPDNVLYVNEINYRLYNDFMIDAHKSCSGVIVPQSGIPAINLMCGNAPVCDADAWFGFSGNISVNPIAPVQVNFLRWPTPEDSMNARAPLCNETLAGNIPCSCIDCLANCGTLEVEIPDICEVLSVNCIGFSVGITFFVLTAIIFIILTLREYRKYRRQISDSEDLKYVYKVNVVIKIFQKCFQNIGIFTSDHPVLMILFTSWIAFGVSIGISQIIVTANPIELWSAPDSRSRQELNYFNSRFGPFYRASQVFMTFNGLDPFTVGNITYGPAFRLEAIQELIKLENAIIDIGKDDNTVTLTEVCYAPTRYPGVEKRFDQCLSMSITTYLPDRNNINNETYLNSIQGCINNYLALNCLADWGGGADPDMSFGGFSDKNYLEAKTLIINYPIASHLRQEDMVPVFEWEKKFIDLMQDYEKNWKSDFVDIAFGADRSIEDEIDRVSRAEIVPIAISYLIMFCYVILALGNVTRLKSFFVECKISVAVCCIIIVIIAIACAAGILGYTGITISLLALNVIPFFILSVGIDNVFLMVNELHYIESNLKSFEDYKEDLSFNMKRRYVFGKMMKNVGPSMFVSSLTQISCFSIGTISNLPAVRTFAIFAAIALGFLFLFQITIVVGILSIDYRRTVQNRYDIFCCIRKKVLDDENPLQDGARNQGIIQRFMEPYANFILNWRVKITVALLFMAMIGVSVILIPQIEVGLDQEMALPQDSFVYKYLQAVNNILPAGPPVFFVVKSGLNFTNHDHQNVLCGGLTCNEDSLSTQIFVASRNTETTYIQKSSNSWLDDFLEWTTLPGSCCKYNSTDGGFCSSKDESPECEYCSIERSDYAGGLRPAAEAFGKHIPAFLKDPPGEICSKGGLASYGGNVNYVLDSQGLATVYDTKFMAFHKSLVTSKDYFLAVKNAYEISANITKTIQTRTGLDVEVFPYSVFYVYYEQYLTIWEDAFASIGFSLLGALFINFLVTGFNFLTTGALLLNVIMIVVELMGVMFIWNIPLNAVSTINLIVAIGIAVEFCSHMAYAYATSKCPPKEKVHDAIKKVGSTIITGITLTNVPIIVLAFSYTEIIEVFFFRMLFSLVILGFLHGMVFFPVLLSFLNDIKHR
ncbi:NPC intracellular cholesterol transporter 1 homolog 1b-like [Danaus plexippus]|uniref:NPC intracellular cholesterol transporter 1 homolog 1b-like n=1 Tax=Danaus plexippus TaxID=13037 RepID=UPI002AB2A590|nr:NPC intracellular cholesterol transporter 1 homolog 1b-like [Danaus plexippus]